VLELQGPRDGDDMFADVEALGHWRHNKALDGMADCVFWGRDDAQTLGAPRLDDGGAIYLSGTPRNECAPLRARE
jgi:hypothetical protein